MNDQDLPENGNNPSPTAAVEHVVTSESPPPGVQVFVEDVDVSDIDEDLEQQEFADDEELDDDADLDDEELDDEELILETTRSLVEELFDEDDLGEVMSELDVLTLEDAAAYLKVEYGQIRRMLREQGLPGRKIGEEWRFLRGALADWLRAPGGVAVPVVAAAATAAVPERHERPLQNERPAQSERREFTPKPPLRERFSQGNEGQQQRYPQQGGTRYPQQAATRYPQENRPPRRPQNEGGGYPGGGYPQGNQGGYQGGGQRGGYQGGGAQGGGYQGGGSQGGGYQSQGGQGSQGQGGQGGYPPPRRPRYGNDQEQQLPQGEYQPPRRPFAGGQGGNFSNQGGGSSAGGGPSGSAGGTKYGGGPKKPKRKALNEQRFKRLDKRKGEDDSEQGGSADSID